MRAAPEAAALLDDPQALARADPRGMLEVVAGSGRQLLEGLAAGRAAGVVPPPDLRSVVVCGMGGSAAAGDLARSALGAELPVPLAVVRGYVLPGFCGPGTLVLAVSHSGDTEETLAAYDDALRRGCRVAAVSAGGELARRAERDGVPRASVPGADLMPRSAVGYLAGAVLGVLEQAGLASGAGPALERTAATLEALARDLGPERPAEENEAKSLALWLMGGTPLVWGSEGVAEGPAMRWKTQLNENAKVPAFHAVLPELDHNEVEGWHPGAGAGYRAVVLRHPGEHPRVAARVEATLASLEGSGLAFRAVQAVGDTPLEWVFSLVLKGDFASTYLALARGVDPTPAPVLAALKERLRR
ncbi:MAG TPA: bifunctional phosphoglucose/phosphomannose isomerase [Actinomycetota bacterium]|nr:bifunctional phosphoglucose/phosphomannose isomerase [Actinomycetota bacterium]